MKRPGRKYVVRGAALALALLLTALDFTGALAVTQADINALQSDADELDAKRKELESQLDSLSDDKAQALKRKELLDQQISNTSAQIANVEAQISEYEELITQTEAELADAEEREEAQYELFCSRVRSMEEQGTVSYWSMLFKADSFTDLLSRLDFVNEIMDYDQRVIQDLQDLQQEITEKRSRWKTAAVSLRRPRPSWSVRSPPWISKEPMRWLWSTRSTPTKPSIRARWTPLMRKRRPSRPESWSCPVSWRPSRQRRGQTTSNAALGGYIWPVSSRRITSPFGNRNTGIAGASTNHKGVDIGGVYYSSEVHAAKSGTVIVSQYSSSYGNYVVVSHGSGNTTLYAHMSSRSVSVGQWVDQGDVLGITGSTGISSGPHLHFEITENGVRVDPLQYLTGYVQAW